MTERFEDLNVVKKNPKKIVNQSETEEENSVCPLRASSDLSKQMEIEAVILAPTAAKVSLVTVCRVWGCDRPTVYQEEGTQYSPCKIFLNLDSTPGGGQLGLFWNIS